MILTPHFSVEELTASDTATRLGIDNSIPDILLPNLHVLATGLERARLVLAEKAINVNSGYRCEALEMVLTAKDYAAWCSRHGHLQSVDSWKTYFLRKSHPKALAADLTCRAFGPPKYVVEALVKQAQYVRFDQCIFEGSWVHLSFSLDNPRLQYMTATFDANGVPHYQTHSVPS